MITLTKPITEPTNNFSQHPESSSPLDSFATVSLSELGAASLLERVETKYVLALEGLDEVLRELQTDYRVLDVHGVQHPYRSLYFDTPDFSLYRRHHAGARGRYKLRSRSYVSTDTHFFEVKHKNNKGRTLKRRVSTSHLVASLGEVRGFLSEAYPASTADFSARLENTYTRTTLVSPAGDERVTVDTGLEFCGNGERVSLPNLVIGEVKRESRAVTSAFMRQTKDLHISPHSLSKYCLGVSLLYPVKHNRFKPTLRRLGTLTEVVHA